MAMTALSSITRTRNAFLGVEFLRDLSSGISIAMLFRHRPRAVWSLCRMHERPNDSRILSNQKPGARISGTRLNPAAEAPK
jgi:hypothetical protein